MIKGVLFDMDGVLFNTERPAALADAIAAQKMGYTLPEAISQKLPGGNAQFVKNTICGYFGPEFDYTRFAALMREELDRLLEAQGGVTLMPGVAKTLDWIYSQGIPMCVASSTRGEKVQRYLFQTKLRHYFTAIVGGDMVKRSKPAPDIFIKAAEALRLPPALCVAVEDSYNGVRSAVAAGCATVMIPDMLPATEEMRGMASAVLNSMAALPGYIQAQAAIKPN